MNAWLVPAATMLTSAGLARVAAGYPTTALIQDEPDFLEKILEALTNFASLLQWILETKVLGIPKSPLELIVKLFPGDIAAEINTAWSRVFTPPTLAGSFWGIFLVAAAVVGFLLIHINFGWWLWKLVRAIPAHRLKTILQGKVKDLPSPLVYPIYNYAVPLVVVMLGLLLMQLAFNVVYFVLGQFIGLLYEGSSFGVAAFEVVTNVLTGWGFMEFTTAAPALLVSFWIFLAFLIMRFLMIPVKGARMILWVGRYSHRDFAIEVARHEAWSVAQSYISLFLQLVFLVAIPVAVQTPPFSLWGGTTKVIPAMLTAGVIAPWILFGLTLIPAGVAKWLRPKGDYNVPGVDWEKHIETGKRVAPEFAKALLLEIPEAAIALQLYQTLRKPDTAGKAVGSALFQPSREGRAPSAMRQTIPETPPKPRDAPKVTGEGRSLAQDYIQHARTLGAGARNSADEIFGFAAVLRSSDPSSFDELAPKAYESIGKMSDDARKKWARVGKEMKDKLAEEQHGES